MVFRKPFAIESEEKRLMISRYLVESNELNFMYLNTELTNDVVIIKSILKTTLNNYKLYTEE
jgi:hypothetical protein